MCVYHTFVHILTSAHTRAHMHSRSRPLTCAVLLQRAPNEYVHVLCAVFMFSCMDEYCARKKLSLQLTLKVSTHTSKQGLNHVGRMAPL